VGVIVWAYLPGETFVLVPKKQIIVGRPIDLPVVAEWITRMSIALHRAGIRRGDFGRGGRELSGLGAGLSDRFPGSVDPARSS
jgi:hypothetical protein